MNDRVDFLLFEIFNWFYCTLVLRCIPTLRFCVVQPSESADIVSLDESEALGWEETHQSSQTAANVTGSATGAHLCTQRKAMPQSR